ncbi:MAG: porin family protein [Gammaproteobacteria bacterium]|nr:porin family protein [Gammaproteobacteria bacterium]
MSSTGIRYYANNGHTALWFFIGITLLAASGACLAAGGSTSHREGQWQTFFSTNYVDSETIDFDGGAQADINGDMGWIFGFGYNFNENLALDFEVGWNSVSYTGTRILEIGGTEEFGGWLDTSGTRFNLTYNFMAKAFTPFISANIGWAWIDSNIPSGPPSSTCWWDPWWGYICTGYQPTYSRSEFAYGAGLGVRFDLGNNVFLRGMVNQQWLDISGASSTPDFLMYRFDLGFMFGS